MSKYERTVFGRRKVQFEGREFTIEMRKDGIFVRRKRGRYEWNLKFATLLNHAKLQPELFYTLDQSDPTESLPGLPKELLVRNDGGPVNHPLHEGGEPAPQGEQVGGDGVGAPVGPDTGSAEPPAAQSGTADDHQLSEVNR